MASQLLQYHVLSSEYYDNKKEFEVIERLCTGFESKSVLEVGCGIGRLAPLITQKGGVYTGVDSRREFIEYCKMMYKLQFVKAHASKLPFENEKFDILLYPWVLPDVKDLLSVLKEGYRVLKKNGVIIVIDGTFLGDYGKLIKEFFKKTKTHRNLYFSLLRDSLVSTFRNIQTFETSDISYYFPNLESALKEITMELRYLERLKLTRADEERISRKLKKFKQDNKVVINETVAFHKSEKL